MTAFDGILIGILFACLIGFQQIRSNYVDKKRAATESAVVFIVALVVLCILASWLNWESTLFPFFNNRDTENTDISEAVTENSDTPDETVENIDILDEGAVDTNTPEDTNAPEVTNTPEEAVENTDIPGEELSGVEEKTNSIIATMEMEDTHILDCPEFNKPAPFIYSDQKEIELSWKKLKNYDHYSLDIFERSGDDIILLYTLPVIGLSYKLDVGIFEKGKTYSINVVADDKYFSIPIFISMLE